MKMVLALWGVMIVIGLTLKTYEAQNPWIIRLLAPIGAMISFFLMKRLYSLGWERSGDTAYEVKESMLARWLLVGMIASGIPLAAYEIAKAYLRALE